LLAAQKMCENGLGAADEFSFATLTDKIEVPSRAGARAGARASLNDPPAPPAAKKRTFLDSFLLRSPSGPVDATPECDRTGVPDGLRVATEAAEAKRPRCQSENSPAKDSGNCLNVTPVHPKLVCSTQSTAGCNSDADSTPPAKDPSAGASRP
jgi:hypothetical protein